MGSPGSTPADDELLRRINQAIDNKTKPLGALGRLEDLARQVCLVQQRTDPVLSQPALLVFAADHGIATEGVSAYPQSVTYQMVLNFLGGGAAVNVFARQSGMRLQVVDAGVAHDFDAHPDLLVRKLRHGTRNFLLEAAMSADECSRALATGAELVGALHALGTNVIGFGEMGIGNTSSASVLASLYCDLPLADCVGRGTGLDDAGVARKRDILQRALDRHGRPADAQGILRTYGGLEIAMIAGGILEAARRRMIVLIDGFIVSAALAAAHAMQPQVLAFCVFSHLSREYGHAAVLSRFGARPLLDMEMRLGEGSGAALAYPLVRAAAAFMNEMATFESAAVSRSQ